MRLLKRNYVASYLVAFASMSLHQKAISEQKYKTAGTVGKEKAGGPAIGLQMNPFFKGLLIQPNFVCLPARWIHRTGFASL